MCLNQGNRIINQPTLPTITKGRGGDNIITVNLGGDKREREREKEGEVEGDWGDNSNEQVMVEKKKTKWSISKCSISMILKENIMIEIAIDKHKRLTFSPSSHHLHHPHHLNQLCHFLNIFVILVDLSNGFFLSFLLLCKQWKQTTFFLYFFLPLPLFLNDNN